MKKVISSFVVLGFALIFLASLNYCEKRTVVGKTMINKAFKIDDIISLFTVGVNDIKAHSLHYMEQVKQHIEDIIVLPDNERNWSNTAKALDEAMALYDVAIAGHIYEALELLSPDKVIRDTAHEVVVNLQQFWVDQVTTNKKLYKAFKAYVDGNAQQEHLSDEQRYFIAETVKYFEREGLSKSDEILNRVKELKKELAELSMQFGTNIAQDKSTIQVTRDELQGLPDDFIENLKKSQDGNYILGVDYPTLFNVMENCSISLTRKKLREASNNRAYPANDILLKSILEKRDELAQLLGFESYAQFDLSDQMVLIPERAYSFINELISKSQQKVEKEMAQLTKELPASVELTADGKLQPWDFSYLENEYKKKHYNIDEQKIAEYFPMEKTIDELLDIYRQFLGVEFEEVPVKGLWHPDVKAIRVHDKKGTKLLGTLFLDLYPRDDKYSHAAHTTIIPGTIKEDGSLIPDVSIVIANFPKSTATKPSLLKRSDVKTFFHEFGHAMHAILGSTTVASQSGTRTKTDFVELPSQMLEEWLYDKEILKKVSNHYQTGESLPDEIIDSIIALKNLVSGNTVQRQAFLSLMSLDYHNRGVNKDPYDIMKQLHEKIRTHIVFDPADHFYASFGHLAGYDAKYYGYLWSKVFALDLFEEIKKVGLLNSDIGQKYVHHVLSKGGSQDPNELLHNFLGREPSMQAFLSDLGL